MPPKYENIINASNDFITLIDRNYCYEFANRAYCKEIGKTPDQMVGKTIETVWGREKFEKRIKSHIDQALAGQENHDIDRFIWGGMYKYIHVTYYPYYEEGQIRGAMVYSHDISQVKNLEARLIDFEFKDPVTGLFNRKSFDIVLDMELEKARRSQSEHLRGVVFVKLNGMAEVNLQYGHEIGDLLLESTGQRLKDTLRASDHIFRFGGNEFAVVLCALKRASDLATVAEKLHLAISEPYPNKEATISLGCNIGLALYPADGEERVPLVRNAVSAMNDACQRGEASIIYNQDLHRKSMARLRTRSGIRGALVDEQFELRFQPIFDASMRVKGAEALIRWQHPEEGSISPAYFIPIAEESGDALILDRWVLCRVFSYLEEWQAFMGQRYISVNLSARELDREENIHELMELLAGQSQPIFSRIKLELTETHAMGDVGNGIRYLEMLREAGIGVFIDDFGSGYSSLAYLKTLPAESIKIDKSFVDPICHSPEDLEFLAGMVRIIQSRGKQVIVEGVESPQQLKLLKTIPNLRYQGFVFSQALGPMEFAAMLKQQMD